MRIWLATVGEPLPVDPGTPRLLRTGQFAAWLAARGHEVVFFTNTMDHYARRLRATQTTSWQVASNYRIVALDGRHYERSVSVARFRNHADAARAFPDAIADLPAPDIVMASYPTEELCRVILDHCVPLKIPVVIDTRDFWPDIFGEQLPGPFRPLAPLVFYPFRRAASRTLARADALSGMTESAMDWALAMAGRARRHTDFWFPFSYRKPDHHGARSTHSGLRLCFLGTLSPRSNLETIIEAVRIARNRNINVSIDICGRGEVEPALHQRASGLDAVRFAGWLDAEALASVMASSDLGVLPYDRPDFHLSIPNKFVEYLAGDLPVLSCTDGEVRTLIEQTGCGVWSRPTPEAMADAIAAIQPADLERMRKEAAGTFATTFEENAVFSKALACLQNIVQTRSSGSAA